MSIFSKLFSSGKKDFTYTGPRPPASLLDVTGGKDYYDTITNRLAGRNVGFGDNYASLYSSPIIKNMRRGFTDYTIPELTSELSRTGRRRGSPGFSQIKQAYGEQADKEGDIFSRLQMRNEDQSRNEINDALERLGLFNRNEYDVKKGYSDWEYNNIYAPQVDRELYRMGNEAKGYQKLGELGVRAAMVPFTGGVSMMGYTPATSSYDLRGGIGNADIGYGRSGQSLNQRLAQRARYAQRGGYR